jgi:hypothetical protein
MKTKKIADDFIFSLFLFLGISFWVLCKKAKGAMMLPDFNLKA